MCNMSIGVTCDVCIRVTVDMTPDVLFYRGAHAGASCASYYSSMMH